MFFLFNTHTRPLNEQWKQPSQTNINLQKKKNRAFNAHTQTFKGRGQFQTNVESQVSAMAYLDLIVRSVSEPGLIQIIVRFLLDTDKFDGQRILDVLVERLNSNDSRVSGFLDLNFFLSASIHKLHNNTNCK